MKIELVSSSHSVGESGLHLQFTPAYRKPIFETEEVRQLTELYLKTKSERMKIILSAIDFGKDHVHLFLNAWKNYSIEQLAKELKGFSSRMMRKNHRNLFKKQLYGKKFWSEGYFYRTVGKITSESVKYYIENSQQKHWDVLEFEVYKQKTLSEFN